MGVELLAFPAHPQILFDGGSPENSGGDFLSVFFRKEIHFHSKGSGLVWNMHFEMSPLLPSLEKLRNVKGSPKVLRLFREAGNSEGREMLT